MSEIIAELSASATRALRDWLASPNGSHTQGRLTVEAVGHGGILVRVRDWEPEVRRAPVSDLPGAGPDWCADQSVDEYVRSQRR